MYKRKRVTAIILAGGTGSRMGVSENKVYLPLAGRPALWHGAKTFDQHPYVDELVLAVRESEQERARAFITESAFTKPCRLVLGGDSRQTSVRNALKDVKSKLVLVHDGARPLVHAQLIFTCVEALDKHDGAIVALPVEAHIYSVSRKQKPPKQLREPLYRAQTPQGFRTKILRRCHDRHRHNPGITDDSCLLELEGYQVGIVSGDPGNIKLTTPIDLSLAEMLIASKPQK